MLQSLRALVGYGFFWQKNDLVVHTRAMYAGLPREQSWVSYHEGSAVTHFSYFREALSRARLLAALLRPERATKPEGFQGLREALDKQSFSALRELPRPDREKRAVTGTVLFLPDLFGPRLGADGAEVWPSTAAITQGGLGSLQREAQVTVLGLVDASPLAALAEALGGDQAIEPVPYDWRGGSVEAARALAQALARRKVGAPPVAVVAHGLGALGVLELLRETSGSAGEDPLHGVPLLLVAPPLHGAEAALLLWLGEGRLFAMLKCLDGEATASDIAGLLQGLPGIAELLPDQVLDPAWWERAGVTAPDPDLLAAIARRRAEHVKLAVGRTDASFLLGAAEATPAVTFADRRRIESGENGDGWMVNPVSLLPEARVWFAPALHERVLLHPLGAATAADVLRSGTSARGSRQPPKDRPRRQPPPFVFPSQADLEGELVAADAAGEPGREWVLHAQVAHGSLDRLVGRPLLVGHYDADGIWGAEAFLDRCVEGRLGHRHRLGNYPGPAGTATYVPAPGCHPEGALVVGLGDVGDLTAGRLSQGVERAVIERALHAIDARTDRFEEGVEAQCLPLASLLIGTRGGLLTLRQSMVAVLRGVLRARRALARAGLDRFVTLDDVAFVELWSDIAIAAGHALQEVDDDAGLGREPGEHVLPAPTLKVMEGARGNSPSFAGEWSWWRRIIISEEPDGGARGGLQFVTLGERSRAEERMVFTQRPLVDELIARAPKDWAAIADGGLVNALFELLLPVPLKETVYEGRDLVLVVDRRSGRYPWELLARRSAAGIEPLVSRVRLVRQFRTDAFREVVAPARSDHALVIGEPDLGDAAATGFPPLEGARLEAEAVVEELKRRSYSVESSVGEGGHQIIQKLFLRDYRVLHVAAHGDYHADRPEASGVIIGRNADGSLSVLSADLFRQLRAIPELVFLNCCHLGRLDQPGAAAQGLQSDADRTRLAASVAEAVMGLGVRCLVVAGWAVNDRAAHAFAREFYRRMLRGETFGDAVHQARCAVWKDYARTTTWGAYQCYGDPSFRLRSPRGANGGPRSFVSALELVGAVTDVTAAASATGSSASYRQELQLRLRGVETFLANHEDWRSGELLHEMAEAWKATGDFQRAVGLYRAALLARDATAPLKSAEQLCNLLDGLDRKGIETPAGDTPLELAAQADERPRAVVWLEWVERVAQTPERASLRGGILKRAAQRATPRDRPALLAAAASAYELAVELRRKQDGTVHYYPGLNVAALRWARGLSRARAARTKLVADYVAPSRRSARREEAAEGRTLWNAIALPEADLLEALILGELDAAKAKALAGRFERVLRNLGTPTEHLSARRQVEFLAALAVGQRARARQGLDTIFAAFPKE
ncbi:MAG TPA: CHAT domain-containing protein [Planctomycetota bacterium]|nr:CHAT domain-containing protein [Planctomycetota bacterium]